ncbi:uncharacterized protein C9orf85 homolog isoform X2 [Globicephala melas]|uniref:uncharacterized protein C9orf85 homolog isoform X2 n=1 Tax=Globicephala melas TaxID=9731 RepID=UPI00293D66E5|nr:uncharacterized protein C9orf85 homolog isoform X2 [Globicephala melas]
MSSQKGNVARSRPQRHQNTFSFKNDKFDKSVQTKKINAKLHDGVCQRCKEVLEWRVKYSKYKPLSKPKKCTRASHCCDLSRCGAQAPDAQAQWPWLMGPAAPRHVGSSWTRA